MRMRTFLKDCCDRRRGSITCRGARFKIVSMLTGAVGAVFLLGALVAGNNIFAADLDPQVALDISDGTPLDQVLLELAGKAAGATVSIARFVRYERGEGIEKKTDDFAAEVAKMAAS